MDFSYINILIYLKMDGWSLKDCVLLDCCECMMDITVGMELELLVLDGDYMPVDGADRLLRYGLPGVVPECSYSMIEVNSDPGDIFLVKDDLYGKVKALHDVAESEGLHVLPLDIALGSFTPHLREGERYDAKSRLLGHDKFLKCAAIQGQHTHYGLMGGDGERTRQVNFLTLADPVGIALMSTSPRPGVWNARLMTYRNDVYGGFEYQGMLQPLKQSFSGYLQELDVEFEKLKSFAASRDVGVGEVMDRYNSIAGPVRLSQHGTVETRTPGSHPSLDHSVAYAALLLGGMRRYTNEEGVVWDMTCCDDSTETFKSVYTLADKAMRSGLEDSSVRLYASIFLDYCYGGLKDHEKPLVGPVLDALKSGRTPVTDSLIKGGYDALENASITHRQLHNEVFMPSLEQAGWRKGA